MSRKDIIRTSRYLSWIVIALAASVGMMAAIWVSYFLWAHRLVLFGFYAS